MSNSALVMAPATKSTLPALFHQSHSPPDLSLPNPPPKQSPPRSSLHSHLTYSAASVSAVSPVLSTTLTASPSHPTLAGTVAAAKSPTCQATPPTSAYEHRSPSTPALALPNPIVDPFSKSLPSLPAFDIPLFDLDFDLDADSPWRRKSKQFKDKCAQADVTRRVWEEFAKTDLQSTSVLPAPTDTDTAVRVANASSAAVNAGETEGAENIAVLSGRPRLPNPPSPGRQEGSDTAELAAKIRKQARKRALVDRPLSWIPGSKSGTVDHGLTIRRDPENAPRQLVAGFDTVPRMAEKINTRPTDGALPHRMASDKVGGALHAAVPLPLSSSSSTSESASDWPRAVSTSFADFARRSWMSRSPSPLSSTRPKPRKSAAHQNDCQSDSDAGLEMRSQAKPISIIVRGNCNGADAVDGSNGVDGANDKASGSWGRSGRERSDTASTTAATGRMSSDDAGYAAQSLPNGSPATVGSTDASNASSLASLSSMSSSAPSSTSRALNRASEYLTRIKHRPQSMFVRTVSSPSLMSYNGGLKNGRRAKPSKGKNNRFSSLHQSLDFLPHEPQTEITGRESMTVASSASGRTSNESSVLGSSVQPASEAESLTTADTSYHNFAKSDPPSHDPLRLAFKELDMDFYRFHSKTTTSQRMVLLRATLVPFLRRYASDSSNKNTKLLLPEDIEHRASILNRWWIALLELLDQSQQQLPGSGPDPGFGYGSAAVGGSPTASTYFPASTGAHSSFSSISGVDRPVLLEAISMITSRPEWRLLTTSFRPLRDRSPGERVRARTNTADGAPIEESNMFAEESAEQNIRTMFTNNLVAQLVLIVNKMALRHVPMSVVNFSGKACAYAFFFVPGVADILVRLWGLDARADLIRRAADAFGLPRRCSKDSEDLVALFPPCVGPLGWSSVGAMHAKLRRAPNMGLLASASVADSSRVQWFAPYWLSRWRGADTDLLFIFCKYYHILADDFMPATLQLPLVERARAPGFVLLHAQLLRILDNTIHHQAAVEAAMLMTDTAMNDDTAAAWSRSQQQHPSFFSAAVPTSDTADVFLPSMLLQPSHNLFREMDENRIIALLQDFLSSGASLAGARDTFAEVTMALLKATARRTSQYDHNACYTLCDFLYEVLLAFDSCFCYSTNGRNSEGVITAPAVDLVDWSFWLDVCKMLLASNNTMSEIRVLSFVFSTWDIIASDPVRKEALCMQWLLTEEVFDRFFNNWCPMVRAYYMRLLCWRICRDSGSSNELNDNIFLLASQRLITTWSHYLWLKQRADSDGLPPPSTAPSLPQPGKRLMIVRTEVNGPQLGLLANTSTITSNSDVVGDKGGSSASTSSDRGRSNGRAGPFGDRSRSSSTSSSASRASSTDIEFLAGLADENDSSRSSKKKWSLLGKVLNRASNSAPPGADLRFSSKHEYDSFERMRRETASSRSGISDLPLPLPKIVRLGSPSSDSDSSTGSAPVFDAAQFVFRFMLHNIPWQPVGGGPVGEPGGIVLPPVYRERILSRPRLPAPAQARVSARTASSGKGPEAPPRPAAGLPPFTRRISGIPSTGLISEAKNANPAESVPMGNSIRSNRGGDRLHLRDESDFDREWLAQPTADSDDWAQSRSSTSSPPAQSDKQRGANSHDRECQHSDVQPVEPKGPEALSRAKYSGRALAEWVLVIDECNSFVERRRQEGIYGLKDVEVPTLGIEGLRRSS